MDTATATPVNPEHLALTTWEPRPSDRCDRCNGDSRAYTKADKDEFVLYFCGHHTREYEATLVASGWNLHVRIDILEDQVRKATK